MPTRELTKDPGDIKIEIDDDFVPRAKGAVDDESTIKEAEEQTSSSLAAREVKTLHHESAMPLEQLMKQYQEGMPPADIQPEKLMMVRERYLLLCR